MELITRPLFVSAAWLGAFALPLNDPKDPAMTFQQTPSSGLDRLTQRGRQLHDTAAGCHGLAAADRRRAGAMDTAMGRAKLEHSAAAWKARGDMLQRLDASHEARLRAVAA